MSETPSYFQPKATKQLKPMERLTPLTYVSVT